MSPTPQIKAGKSITLIQLIISVVGILGVAVGLYVKNAVAMAEMNIRLTAIEKRSEMYQASAVARAEARNAQINILNESIHKNTDEINILKATKKDK